MKLIYHKGNNFGDKLNPIIFNRLIGEYLDDNENEVFVGIGSILGFPGIKNKKRKIVFSSGYAYDTPPIIDSTWDIICVRGELTTKLLNIKKEYAVTDGALLITQCIDIPKVNKKYKYSFIPHVRSENNYDWRRICEEVGYNYISPQDDVHYIIDNILMSEVVIADALHGAIVADALRVPWIPVRTYKTVNEFKWNDWTSSMGLKYTPIEIPQIFNHDILKGKIKNKFYGMSILNNMICDLYNHYQNYYLKDKLINEFCKLKSKISYLSDDGVLDLKLNMLLERLEYFKRKYSNI